MKSTMIVAMLVICFSYFGNAQHTINGVVIDGRTEEVLIGALVQEKGTSNAAITEIDGSFELILASDQAQLVVSYLGYKSSIIDVEGLTSFNIKLSSDGVQLDEVVVTGLGGNRQKRELGYSAEKFSGKSIALSNAPNVVNALSGKSAGVQIASPNGVDGGTSRITIRGNNNIRANNQPLIIVDGVPLQNDPGLTDIGRGVDWGSAINNINPDDIESLNILKGPTAAAKYGTRGANGVILITTKRGSKQKGLGVQYGITHKVIQPYRFRDVQNKYGAGGPINLLEPTFKLNADGEAAYPSAVHVSNGPFGRPTTELFGFYSTGVSWGPELDGTPVRWWDGELRNWDPQPDNLGLFFENGSTTNHNINFSAGGALGNVRLSLSAQDHEAVIPNSNFNQYTVNLGSNLNVSDKITADIAISYVNYSRKNSPSLGDDNNASFGKGILYSWPRSYKGLEKDINILPIGTRNNYGGNYPFSFSPPHLWWNAYHQNTYLNRDKIIGSLALNYDPTNWLKVTGRIGMDMNTNQFEKRFDPIDLSGVGEGLYANELVRDQVLNNEFLITAYKDKFLDGPIGVKFSVGGTQWSRSQYGIKAETNRWENPWLFSFNNFEEVLSTNLPQEIRYDKKINSLYAFLNLSYENYLFLELSGRNDWSSALPIDNNSYFYPSASLSFIASEAFDIKNKWISFLKLRGAWAQTASDTDPFQVNFIYNTNTFAGNQTATYPNVIPPVALRPQQANSFELGTTIGFFEDKINLDLTYYQISSFDQILDSPVPTSSGAAEIRINNGVLENKGFEGIISATVFQRKGFYIETGLNFSRNRNFVKSLGDGAKFLELANIWGLNGPAIAVQEGDEYGTIYGYDYVRHEGTGQPILNDEGTHYQVSANRVPIGNSSPKLIGGWNMRMGWKGFTLSTLIDAKIGGDVYAGSYVIGQQTGQSPSTLLEREGGGLPYTDPDGNVRNVGVILPGVYADGTPNDKIVHYYFKYLPNAGGWGPFLSSPGVLENSWVKMREIALSYKFSDKLLDKMKIFQSMTASVVGRDLFYIYSSLPDRINPEGNNGAGNAQGLEWASYPGMRSISLRLLVNL